MRMKTDIAKLRELLEQASAICSKNLHKAENIDPVIKSFSYILDSMMETLDENFEVFGEETE